MAQTVTDAAGDEKERFGFGENWRRFAAGLSQDRIDAAKRSLIDRLGEDPVAGKSFLDIGSGSGLFSISAVLLGADTVHSLDYDPDSVATTESLRREFAPDASWTIERGSAIDREYMDSLGQWDVVYSWGVLHHTGEMWKAMENACARVRPGGRLFISIYNDQGRASRLWTKVKRLYNRLPEPLRTPYVILMMLPMELRALGNAILGRKPGLYIKSWSDRGEGGRGMSRWHDMVDWVGGYPFEVASPEEVFRFCAARGFELRELSTVAGGLGCNEFVFERQA